MGGPLRGVAASPREIGWARPGAAASTIASIVLQWYCLKNVKKRLTWLLALGKGVGKALSGSTTKVYFDANTNFFF